MGSLHDESVASKNTVHPALLLYLPGPRPRPSRDSLRWFSRSAVGRGKPPLYTQTGWAVLTDGRELKPDRNSSRDENACNATPHHRDDRAIGLLGGRVPACPAALVA